MGTGALALFISLAVGQGEAGRTQARALVDEGNRAFRSGAFDQALERFRAAYEAFPSSKILVNLAEAHRALGAAAPAVRYYDQFLAEAADTDPEIAQQVRMRLMELEPQVGRMEIDGPPNGAEVRIDGAVVGKMPVVSVAVAPGSRRVRIDAYGWLPQEARVDVTAGTKTTLGFKLAPDPRTLALKKASAGASGEVAPATTVQADASPPVIERWWFWVGVATVVASAVGVGVLATSGPSPPPVPKLGRTTTDTWEPIR